MLKLIRNRARCRRCGDVLESVRRHDHVACSCGAVAVDGGLDYERRCGRLEDIEELSEFERRPDPPRPDGVDPLVWHLRHNGRLMPLPDCGLPLLVCGHCGDGLLAADPAECSCGELAAMQTPDGHLLVDGPVKPWGET